MTVQDRLCFIRAGYSAQDIAAFEAADLQEQPVQQEQPAPQEQPVQQEQPAPPDQPTPQEQLRNPAPAWAVALNNTLDELRRTIQAGNARFDDMGDDTDAIDSADAALQQYLTGKALVKSNNGGKRK